MTVSTNKHYSHDNRFFEGFLDPYMKYSSGLFEAEDEPLEVGIVRMLDHLLAAGRVTDGNRVLDIGNGWGCFLKRLRESVDVDYTGVNPSGAQLEYIRQCVDRDAPMLHGALDDVSADLEGGYDAIYMIGALCHIEEKTRSLKQLHELLADGGRLVIEDTFFLSEPIYQAHASRQETRFVQQTVFGFAHIQSLPRHFDTVRGAGFRVMSCLDNSDSYARTIDLWIDQLSAMDPEAFPLAQQAVTYMEIAQRGWGYTICNHAMVLEKLPARRRPR